MKEGGGRLTGKRKRGEDSENDYGDDSLENEQGTTNRKEKQDEEMKNEVVGETDEQTIVLSGSLLFIYKRKEENPNEIEDLNIILKGSWRLSIDEVL